MLRMLFLKFTLNFLFDSDVIICILEFKQNYTNHLMLFVSDRERKTYV